GGTPVVVPRGRPDGEEWWPATANRWTDTHVLVHWVTAKHRQSQLLRQQRLVHEVTAHRATDEKAFRHIDQARHTTIRPGENTQEPDLDASLTPNHRILPRSCHPRSGPASSEIAKPRTSPFT